MTDKFYADRPDKDAIFRAVDLISYTTEGDDFYFNPFLQVRYTPRPWWKFWAPKYTVTFEGENK